MSRLIIQCNFCNKNVNELKRKCEYCSIKGCNNCVKTVCCDCGSIMCKKCVNDDEIQCGCYGKCTDCGANVNRGDDGWGCSTCDKWLCRSCRYNTTCDECSSNN